MNYLFKPNFKVIKEIKGLVSIEELNQETGMFSATPEFVRKHGGKLSNMILDQIPEEFLRDTLEKGLFPNIDIRIHRLYPNDIPAYPGWHCDGEFREDYHSQPDLNKIYSRHIICTLSSHPEGVSNTEFLNSDLEFLPGEVPSEKNPLWRQVHRQIEANRNQLAFKVMKDGEMVEFDSWSVHRAMATKHRGWRLFFRISQWHKPNLNSDGFFSKQEQIYKIFEGDGW